MDEWFSKKGGNCPGRERLLHGVPTLYKELLAMGVGGDADVLIDSADLSTLELVAKMLAPAIDLEQSLVEWIESHDQTYPAEPDKWYAICCAGGYVVVQAYFREVLAEEAGGKRGA